MAKKNDMEEPDMRSGKKTKNTDTAADSTKLADAHDYKPETPMRGAAHSDNAALTAKPMKTAAHTKPGC